MTQEEFDVCQKLDIVEALVKSVVNQENQELSQRLASFKGENVQWVLNKIYSYLDDLYESLEREYLKIEGI